MMIEEKGKKGNRRDRLSVVTGGFSGHMGKQHTDSLEDLAH